MATKLKNFRNISTNKLTKLIGFVLLVAAITAVFAQIQFILFEQYDMVSIFESNYKDSRQYEGDLIQAANMVTSIIRDESNHKYSAFNDQECVYYVEYGDETYTNTNHNFKSDFEKYEDSFYCYEDGNWTAGINDNPLRLAKYWSWWIKDGAEPTVIYLAFTDTFMKDRETSWRFNSFKAVSMVTTIGALVIAGILCFVFLIFTTGRRPDDDELHFSAIDRVYSDVLFAAFIVFLLAWGAAGIQLTVNNMGYGIGYNSAKMLVMMATAVVNVAASGTLICIFLSFVRKIKGERLLKHSMVYKLFYHSFDFFKSLFDGRRFDKYPLTKALFYRQLVFIVSSGILAFITLLLFENRSIWFLFSLAIELVILYWYIKGNNKTFGDINKGFNESLEDQMKAERMKIALVTNVSHDLKTPLTSIISYVDLLAQEEELSDTAKDYVKILAQKSDRLKNIVADLFDLAKSTSGNIELELEELDMKKLIEQTLGDMEDKIENAGLHIKTKLPENPVMIYSDGKKLYRVFQNIIDNALKYSLGGTRVFVELEEFNNRIMATIKNTSGYEMDFTAEEVIARFNRGDKSRSTEGSGLGLSIAESFTDACGGALTVIVDGDQFKVMIELPPR